MSRGKKRQQEERLSGWKGQGGHTFTKLEEILDDLSPIKGSQHLLEKREHYAPNYARNTLSHLNF